MRLLCLICGEFIGEVSIEGVPAEPGRPAITPLRYPFNGSMVGSPDPAHGVPAPFDPLIDFEFARCPFGRTHRPMARPDLVLTHKGMVRLPLDGSPAFLDPTARAEVDRDSIGDRMVMVSDEEAEKAVRDAIITGVGIVQDGKHVPIEEVCQPKEVAGQLSRSGPDAEALQKNADAATQAMKEEATRAVYGLFVCPKCGKEFGSEKKMKGHMGGAHRPGKKAKKK